MFLVIRAKSLKLFWNYIKFDIYSVNARQIFKVTTRKPKKTRKKINLAVLYGAQNFDVART